MRSQSIHLGKIFGIPIELDFSWFLIFVLLTWTLATGYFPTEFKGWPSVQYWIIGAVTAIMLFVSVLLHELGHSIVAIRYKIPVKKITLFIFGGVSQITDEPPDAMAEFWIAIAGPAVSFALAGLFALLQPVFTGVTQLLALAKYMALINGTLGLFNLIPGFPLDGGRVFRAIVWGVTKSFHRATLIAANVGRLIAFLFIIFGVWQMFTGNIIGGLWIAFIGWFLESAANAQVQQQAVQDLLTGHTVSQAMSRNFTVISSDTTLQQLTDEHIFGQGRRFFIVMDGEDLKGVLTLHHIKDAAREDWNVTTVAERMIPVSEINVTDPDTSLVEAMKMMDQDGVNQLPVIRDGRVLGVLSRESLISFLRTLQDLGAPPSSQQHLTPSS